jgi:hypothetical protein
MGGAEGIGAHVGGGQGIGPHGGAQKLGPHSAMGAGLTLVIGPWERRGGLPCMAVGENGPAAAAWLGKSGLMTCMGPAGFMGVRAAGPGSNVCIVPWVATKAWLKGRPSAATRSKQKHAVDIFTIPNSFCGRFSTPIS